MIGVVLSHTRMKEHGFCTNLLIDYKRKLPKQIRPRLRPNSNLFYNSLGQERGYMRQYWWPGARVEFDGYQDIPAGYERPTHPEDVIIIGAKCRVVAPPMLPADLKKLVAPITVGSVRNLFPPLLKGASEKGYVVAGTVLERSVGYVSCFSLHIAEENQMLVRDSVGSQYLTPIKDEHILQSLQEGSMNVGDVFQNMVVRFALAGPFHGDYIPEPRCYLMLSHVIFA